MRERTERQAGFGAWVLAEQEGDFRRRKKKSEGGEKEKESKREEEIRKEIRGSLRGHLIHSVSRTEEGCRIQGAEVG